MLLTVGVYVLALFSTFSGHLFIFSLLITGLFLFLLIRNYFPIKYIIVRTLIFYFGVINTSLRLRDIDELVSLAPLNSTITGTIVSIPQGKVEGKPKFFFKAESIKFDSTQIDLDNEKVLVTINSTPDKTLDLSKLKLNDSFELDGRLSAPFKAGNPSQFDYGNYLRNQNAYAVFYANDFHKIDKNLSMKAKLLQSVNDYREKILSIHSKYLPSPNLEILGGIVFGDDAVSPPKEIKQSFINSGLLHILAASGMNVAFIYGFFFAFMSLFKISFRAKVVLGMITVLVYSLMTGLGASVIRATCMLLFVLVGKLIDRDAHSISLLSFVGLLMLIYNPMYINEVGFQLSFIVTFGILVMAPAFAKFNHKVKDFLVSTVTIPIIAQLWVIPIQIFYFNNISLYSVFANIMSVPILMILSFGGFVSSLLSAITPIADFVCKTFDTILNPLLFLLVNISDFWGSLPNSAIQTTHPTVFQILLYYGSLLCLTGLLYKEFREKYLKRICITLSILIGIWVITLIPIKNSDLEITTFDVGNADCFLIKTPENNYIMIDTGKVGYKGGKSQAEIIVLKYLKDRGIKNLDSIVITHFDNDHCGGANDLINGLKVNKIYVNDLNHSSNIAQSIYASAKARNTDIINGKHGQIVYDNKKGLLIKNLVKLAADTDNEKSLITLLEYKDFTMLFTGDAGISGIKSVIGDIPKFITVLKVPHHGANGGLDREILDYLCPEYSIISVGENKFGHPSNLTLELLKGSQILRTDIDNSIRIKVNQNSNQILTYDSVKRKYVKWNKQY